MLLTRQAFVPGSRVGAPTHELRLHDALLAAGPLLLKRPSHTTVAVREFEIRGSRPDIALFDVNLAIVDERRRRGFAPLTSGAELAIRSALLHGRPLPRTTVLDAAGRYASRKDADSALGRLMRKGYLAAVDGCIALDPVCRQSVRRAIGIEAKLGNWRLAARQARRWRLYFDQALLAFPESYAEALAADLPGIQLFGISGVALNGSIRRLAPAPLRRADAFSRVLVEEAFLARYSRETASPDGATAGEQTLAAAV
jgi:hypothetical protein